MRILKIYDGDYPWDVRVEKITQSLLGAGHEVRLLCRNLGGRSQELYAFRSDPTEQRNLAEEQPEEATRLQSALARWQERIEKGVRWDAESDAPLDPAVEDQLRALGYIQ